MTAREEKTCFVIAPMGDEESATRLRSDLVMRCIIKPAAEQMGFKTVRSDDISESGVINDQIIEHLLEDELVIADLTELNPNVFYELGVRHYIGKPVIAIVQKDWRNKLPFDVSTLRVVAYTNLDLKPDKASECGAQVIKFIRSAEAVPSGSSGPVEKARSVIALQESKNPLAKVQLEQLSLQEGTYSMVKRILDILSRPEEDRGDDY